MKKIHDYRYGGIGFIFTLCLILFSCIPDDIELPFRVKSVVTDSVTNVTYCEAKLGGVVSVNDADTVTCGVIYSTYISFLSSKNGLKKPTTANGQYAVVLDLLDANTTYYYRAYAIDAGVYKYGEVLSFSTPEAPSVTTGEASAITHNEATLSGMVSNSGKNIICGFIYGISSELSSTNDAKVDTLSQGAYSVKITNLKSNFTYYYRAYAIVDDEYTYGEVFSFTTESNICEAEAVDLGLSVYWASCNVGAESPEDYGDYFAWGETSSKSNYTESNSITYGLSNTELESRGIIGTDGNLTTAYDAATASWGSEWRMPTRDEMKELVNNCTWEWTTQNGVKGYKVTGLNGNSIFLPAAGYRTKGGVNNHGLYGYYWFASLFSSHTTNAYYLYFREGCYDWDNFYYRHLGRSVRPVSSKRITTGEATDITANGATLSGMVSGADKPVDCGVIYGTSSTLSSTSGTAVTTHSQGEFSLTIATLEANTTYYYRAFVLVDGEYKYGEVKSFTTYVEIPEGAVDLGLSVYWASCNVGAESPEEYGDYFAWGETTTKSNYAESNSVTYGLSISELKSRGIIGANGNLTAAYDAATENWGDNWRMPTLDEIKELLGCTWKWTTQNGVKGRKVTGPNGNSIFLPAAGFRYYASLYNAGSYGYYWSATPYSNSINAYYLYFDSDGYDWSRYGDRYYGRAVRPVSER